MPFLSPPISKCLHLCKIKKQSSFNFSTHMGGYAATRQMQEQNTNLNSMLGNMFATLALQPQHNLLCRFSLTITEQLPDHCTKTITINYTTTFTSTRLIRKPLLPSCGKQASSGHHNPTACDHNDAFPGQLSCPSPSCTG